MQATRNVTKIQRFPNLRWRTNAILKIISLAVTLLHIVCLRQNLQWRGIIARTQRLDDENVKIRKSNMVDGRHFENHYISIFQPQIVRISQNFVCRHKYSPRRQKHDKKIRNSQNSRWRTDATLKIIFFGYNSAPLCPIKTKFGVPRCDHTHMKVMWWKCPISKIQHGGRPPFWKLLYLHISTANHPNCTKFSMQTQILPRRRKCDKKFRNSQIQNGGWMPHWKSLFGYNSAACCPTKLWLVLIYQPRRDERLRRRWCEVAPAEIQTCNLPIANPALYHTATGTHN